MKIKIDRTTKVWIVALLMLLAADWFYLRQVHRQPVANDRGLVSYSALELAKYDGSVEGMPILLAMDGYVYDVSPGRADFYGPGQAYQNLAGKDVSIQLQLFGGEIIKKKYSVVGIYRP